MIPGQTRTFVRLPPRSFWRASTAARPLSPGPESIATAVPPVNLISFTRRQPRPGSQSLILASLSHPTRVQRTSWTLIAAYSSTGPLLVAPRLPGLSPSASRTYTSCRFRTSCSYILGLFVSWARLGDSVIVHRNFELNPTLQPNPTMATSQKLPAGLAGVLNPSDDNRDSAYFSSTDASSKRMCIRTVCPRPN